MLSLILACLIYFLIIIFIFQKYPKSHFFVKHKSDRNVGMTPSKNARFFVPRFDVLKILAWRKITKIGPFLALFWLVLGHLPWKQERHETRANSVLMKGFCWNDHCAGLHSRFGCFYDDRAKKGQRIESHLIYFTYMLTARHATFQLYIWHSTKRESWRAW